MLAALQGQLAQHARSLHHLDAAMGTAWLHTPAVLAQEADLLIGVQGYWRWLDPELAKRAAIQGDAKALAQAYRERGRALLSILDGAFALCAIAAREREVLLAVDRFGVCPLAYAVTSGGLVFGSTLDSIRAYGDRDPALSRQAILHYLYFSTVPSPGSIYQEFFKLEPAQYVHYKNGRIDKGYYWQPCFSNIERAGRDALKLELLNTLEAATRRAHRPNAGAFLSGGLDSSTVCGLLSRLCESPARSFSIGFHAQGYDEMEYARAAARHFGLEAYEYYVTPEDVADAIPVIAKAYDEPFGNSSAIPVYYCARQASQKGNTLLLAGDGGDELFAGNERYLKQTLFNLYGCIPAIVRNTLLEPLAFSLLQTSNLKPLQKLRSYISQAKIPLPNRMETYNFLHRTGLEDIFCAEFLNGLDREGPLSLLQEVYARPSTGDRLQRMLYLDWKFTLADNDLRKVNRMCESCGVEVRYPMLDTELVALSTRIPSRMMLKGLKLRAFYKDALREFLPREVLTKAKHGFGLPFGQWLKTSPRLTEMVHDGMGSLKKRGYIQPAYIERMLHQHSDDHASYYGSMLWMLLILELWLQAH
ncbi:MAG: asparagine synthetase B family protein [Gammaproteobacteria bacterium]